MKNQYEHKHRNLGLPKEELERKFLMFLREQQELEMLMAISAKKSSGGGEGTIESDLTQGPAFATESGDIVITESGEIIIF